MKRLFTNIDVNVYGMSDNEYYKSIVEDLKKCSWEKLPDNKFLCVSVDWLTFYKMTAIDYRFFEEREINYRYEIIYSKNVDGQFSWDVNFYENENKQYSDYLVVENDDLELFQAVEEETDEEKFLDYLSGFVGERPDGDVIELIKQNLTDFWNNIVTDVLENAEVDDIGEVLKDDIAKDWIEQNPDDAYDRAVDNMDSYEMRDKIIDYLQNNL